MVVAKDVLTLSPEEATARFSHALPLARTFDTVDGLVISGGVAGDRLSLSYVPNGSGGYIGQVATLDSYVETAEQAAEVRRAIDRQLRSKLGKPKLYPHSSTPYWKLVGRVEVSLAEFPNLRDVPGNFVVSLQISEPDGP